MPSGRGVRSTAAAVTLSAPCASRSAAQFSSVAPVVIMSSMSRICSPGGSFLSDLIGPMPYADFQCMIDDPPGKRNYWSAEYLAGFGDDAIAAFETG